MRHWKIAPAALAAALLLAAPGGARGEDRHAGYYYPSKVTQEEYVSRAKPLPVFDRKSRIAFTNQVNLSLLSNPYPPPFVLFTKGDEAEKAIIVAVNGDYANTMYRMRALLALLTTISRSTELLREFRVDDVFTFFDQLRLLGFQQLTVSDGRDFAHQVTLK